MTKTRINKNFVDPVAKTRACSFLESAGRQTPATSPVPKRNFCNKEGQQRAAHLQDLHVEHRDDLRKKKISNPCTVSLWHICAQSLRYPLLDHIFWARDNLIKCELQKARNPMTAQCLMVFSELNSSKSICKIHLNRIDHKIIESFVWWYQPVFKMISTISSFKKNWFFSYLFRYIHRGWHPILPSALWIIIIHRFHIFFWTKTPKPQNSSQDPP